MARLAARCAMGDDGAMRRWVLLLSLLCASVGCRREPTPSAARPQAGRPFSGYPPQGTACATDGDCALVGALRAEPGLTGCCEECNRWVAGTRAWAEEAIAACNAAGPCSDPLPCPETTVNPFLAKCEQGRCVVRRNPAVWR